MILPHLSNVLFRTTELRIFSTYRSFIWKILHAILPYFRAISVNHWSLYLSFWPHPSTFQFICFARAFECLYPFLLLQGQPIFRDWPSSLLTRVLPEGWRYWLRVILFVCDSLFSQFIWLLKFVFDFGPSKLIFYFRSAHKLTWVIYSTFHFLFWHLPI